VQPFKRVARMCRTLFRARELDRDLDEELRAYVDDRIAARVAGGASPAEARRLVLAEEGGFESIKEDTRDTRAGFGVATLAQDLRYGWRTLRRSPGYAAVACLVLGLGIGANVAMFTVMRSVLWRPLPYPAPDRLVVLEADVQGVRNAGPSSREVHDLRIRSRALTELAVVNGVDAHVEIHGEIERVAAASVSADLLPALGVRPALGRLFDPRDGSVNGQVRRVIISDALWRRRLGADVALCPNSEGQFSGCLIVRPFGDDDCVVLAHHQVPLFQLPAHGLKGFLGRVEPGGTLLDILDALLSVAEQGDIGRHGVVSPFVHLPGASLDSTLGSRKR